MKIHFEFIFSKNNSKCEEPQIKGLGYIYEFRKLNRIYYGVLVPVGLLFPRRNISYYLSVRTDGAGNSNATTTKTTFKVLSVGESHKIISLLPTLPTTLISTQCSYLYIYFST